MPRLESSADVEHWLTSELGATFARRGNHGKLFHRECPNCGRLLRITVPINRSPIAKDTLSSIYRQCHLRPDGSPRC